MRTEYRRALHIRPETIEFCLLSIYIGRLTWKETRIEVKNLPNNIKLSELQTLFKKFGEVKALDLRWRKTPGDLWAIVTFEEEEHATAAQKELDEAELDENSLLVRVL